MATPATAATATTPMSSADGFTRGPDRPAAARFRSHHPWSTFPGTIVE
jgi:hypothetical protein